jgi:hypothetical protein
MKKIFLIILVIISVIPLVSRAQEVATSTDKYKLLEPLPCLDYKDNGCVAGTMQESINIKDYILYIYKFSIAIAVFLAIVMIIWGGFLYITSETPFKIADGRSKITNALSGLAMVLVSYLILATIDPRLVNIDSNIPPIPYTNEQIKDVSAFQKSIEQDFKNFSAEKQLEINQLSSQISSIAQEKKGIDAKVASKEITAEEAVRQYAENARKALEASVNRSKLIAENNGLYSFTKVIQIINTDEDVGTSLDQYKANTVPNTIGNTPRRTDSENIIQNQYNERINEILKTNSGHDVVQKLDKQRDFYIAEVKEEIQLKNAFNKGKEDGVITVTYNLTERSKKYAENIKNAITNSNNAGLPLDQYVKIMQARIDKIDATLKPKK